MRKSFDVSRAYDIIYLDFQKAFDKVPHDKLIIKMRMVGITGATSEWCEDRGDPNHVGWLGVAILLVSLCIGLVYVHRKPLTEVCCFAV